MNKSEVRMVLLFNFIVFMIMTYNFDNIGVIKVFTWSVVTFDTFYLIWTNYFDEVLL